MERKFVYRFAEGHKDMRHLLGGKGANLAEMTSIGLPVPQGFTITTEACNDYYANEGLIRSEILEGGKKLWNYYMSQGQPFDQIWSS